MAVTNRWYPIGMSAVLNGDINWDDVAGEDIDLALMGTGHSFDDAHDFWSDISANEYGGTGYTRSEIANRAVTQSDSSVLTARANSTAYVKGDLVRTATDSARVFMCVTAGTSAVSEPGGMATQAYFTTITDGTVVWLVAGRGVTILDGDAHTYSGLDGTTGTVGAVGFKDTGTPTTSPLLFYIDFGATETPTQITVTPPNEGYALIPGGGEL